MRRIILNNLKYATTERYDSIFSKQKTAEADLNPASRRFSTLGPSLGFCALLLIRSTEAVWPRHTHVPTTINPAG